MSLCIRLHSLMSLCIRLDFLNSLYIRLDFLISLCIRLHSLMSLCIRPDSLMSLCIKLDFLMSLSIRLHSLVSLCIRLHSVSHFKAWFEQKVPQVLLWVFLYLNLDKQGSRLRHWIICESGYFSSYSDLKLQTRFFILKLIKS